MIPCRFNYTSGPSCEILFILSVLIFGMIAFLILNIRCYHAPVSNFVFAQFATPPVEIVKGQGQYDKQKNLELI